MTRFPSLPAAHLDMNSSPRTNHTHLLFFPSIYNILKPRYWLRFVQSVKPQLVSTEEIISWRWMTATKFWYSISISFCRSINLTSFDSAASNWSPPWSWTHGWGDTTCLSSHCTGQTSYGTKERLLIGKRKEEKRSIFWPIFFFRCSFCSNNGFKSKSKQCQIYYSHLIVLYKWFYKIPANVCV